MERLKATILIVCIAMLLPLKVCYAAAASPANGEATEPFFDVVQANKQFDRISLKLSTENLNPKTLNQAIEHLSELAKESEKCVQKTESKITDLNSQIKSISGEGETAQGRVDTKYLENQRSELTQIQAKCRLFLIRSTEALEAYRKTSLSLQQEITFTKGVNVLQRLDQLPTDWEILNRPILDESKLKGVVDCTIYAAPLLIIALLISWRLRPFLRKRARKQRLNFFFNSALIFLILFFSANLIFVQELFIEFEDNVIYQKLVIAGLVYAALLFIYNLIFALRRIPAMLQWYGFDIVFLKRLGNAVLTIYFIHLIGVDVLILFQATENLMQLFEDVMLIVSLAAMIYFTLILYHSHSEWFKKHFSGTLLYEIIGTIATVLLILDFVGYSILAVNAAYILFSLMLVSALGTVLYRGIANAYHMLSYNPHYVFHLKKTFGYSSVPPFIELILLKILAQFVVIVGMTVLFAQLIGEASYFIDNFFDYLLDGFKSGGITIIPVQWLIGILIFCILSLFFRHIATKISRSQQFEDDEEEKQVAIASIILYAGFAIAIIMGLLFAGFSFTSLAIIAGALSVGIGLGLQSIVNNFFSGLILLIEKPIKPGDRIKIDGIEGFVKKVSVRSTQVVTPSQEDIIIPNSDLITHQVVNYMFSDKFWRVKCAIGVAYDSDIDKVSDVLVAVAMAHPEVVKKPPNKPMVLFRSFGESALMFELWCLIKDVNKKYGVTSDLNFAINKACKDNNITIAFPQHDVHIKFDQSNLPWGNGK